MKKTIILTLILTGFLVFLSPNFSKVQAITLEELQAQIQQLLQIIQQLLAQQSRGLYCFYNDLSYGMRSPEVKNLQIVLGVTPITGYFGDTTLAAVKKFQEEHNIKVTGEVGPQTRAVLNSLYCVSSQCGWCGQDCIRKTPTMQCPDVMPPLGVECKEVNGVCTKVPLVPITKYSCTTVRDTLPTNTYTTCVPDANGTFNSLAECQKVCGSTPTCIDSDGNNTSTKGTVIYQGKTYTDYCTSSTTVGEYICANGQLMSTNTRCSYKCEDGKCVLPTQTSCDAACKSKGYAAGICEGGPVIPSTSTCNQGETPLGEPTADCYVGFGILGTSATCCCTKTIPTCTDSDGGKNYNVKGTVTYNGQTYTDECTNCTGNCPVGITPCPPPTCGAVKEYYCENGVMKYEFHACGSGNTCQDGACVSTCIDSDSGNIFTKGTVTYQGKTYTDYCTSSNAVVEYTCEPMYKCDSGTKCPNSPLEMKQRVISCDAGYTCQDGACKQIPSPSTCTDSDGGKNYNVKGTVTYNGQAHTDECACAYSPCPVTGPCTHAPCPVVREFYCENGGMKEETHVCGSGYICQDGACKQTPTPPACTDSDRGKNYNVKGTVTYNGQVYTDDCICGCVVTGTFSDGVCDCNVYEYSCENGAMKEEIYDCGSGYTCQDGACKLTVATTIPPVATTIPSYGRCSDGSVCSWCGNQCVKFTSGMQCPTVMPSQGATCTCVNNTCTVQYGSTSLMDVLNQLSASLISLMELLKR